MGTEMDRDHGVNAGRPGGQHGELGDNIVDYWATRNRLEAEGRINDQTRQIIAVADPVACVGGALVERDEAMASLLGGRDGLRSRRFLERVRAANRDRGRVIRLLQPEIEPEPEPPQMRAA